MGLPENIDALLVKFDITQEQLARVADVNKSSVTRWRQGYSIRKSTLKKICDYFELTEDDLLSTENGLAAKEPRRADMRTALDAGGRCAGVRVPPRGMRRAATPRRGDGSSLYVLPLREEGAHRVNHPRQRGHGAEEQPEQHGHERHCREDEVDLASDLLLRQVVPSHAT